MQMPTINLLDATAHVFQFLLVIMLMFVLMFILAIMFRGFFSLLQNVVVLPNLGAKKTAEREENIAPRHPLFTYRYGTETSTWEG